MIPGLAVRSGGDASGFTGHAQIRAIGFHSALGGNRGAPMLPPSCSFSDAFRREARQDCNREGMTGVSQNSGFESMAIHQFAPVGSPPRSVAEHFTAAQFAMGELARLADRFQRKSRHQLETAWLAQHRHEYRGRWIALDGNELLADAPSAKEVFAAVSNHKPTPLVMQIPEQDLPFAGW